MIIKQNDDAIKSVKDRVIHGMGVRFGSPETKDFDGEWFYPDSEVGLQNGATRPFLMEHGYSRTFAKAVVASATYEKTDAGWEYDAMFVDTDLGNKAFNEVITKAYKSSAGAAGHTREASMIQNTYRLDTWLIAEQSATMWPADPENLRITRTKSDSDSLIHLVVSELKQQNEDFIKAIFEAFTKDVNASRESLAQAMVALRDSFVSNPNLKPNEQMALTNEFLESIDQVTQPIQLINL